MRPIKAETMYGLWQSPIVVVMMMILTLVTIVVDGYAHTLAQTSNNSDWGVQEAISISSDSESNYESNFYLITTLTIIVTVPTILIILYYCVLLALQHCIPRMYRRFYYFVDPGRDEEWLISYRALRCQNKRIRYRRGANTLDIAKCHHIAGVRSNPDNIEMTNSIRKLVLPYYDVKSVDWHSLSLPSIFHDNPPCNDGGGGGDSDDPAIRPLVAPQRITRIFWNGNERFLDRHNNNQFL
jgi:hypothetical protein